MAIPRWNTKQIGSESYLIECGDVVMGSIVLVQHQKWTVEIMCAGDSGDITADFSTYENALVFVQGVEAGLSRTGYLHSFNPVTVTASDYAYDGFVVSKFDKLSGQTRYVVEDDRGRLFIHNAKQLGLDAG